MCFDIGIVTSGPNEALIVSGVCYGDEPVFIIGGRALVIPCLQQCQRMSLNTMTLTIRSDSVYTGQGVPISVTGIAQVKINGENEEMLRSAAEQFESKEEDEVAHIAQETLEGHQRAMMGNMTVEEIYKERKTFSNAVLETAKKDFINFGMSIISYTLKDIRDDVGYLKSLGETRTSEVQRDTRIGEAEAQRDAGMAEAESEMQRMSAKLANDTEIARAKRDFDLKKATYDVEVNTAKAEAEKAYELQAASVQQKIKEQQIQIEVVERQQQIEIQEQEILRKERELDSNIKKPAEAEKYRLEKIAEAERLKSILEAEAEAEAMTLKGEAEAFAIEAKAKAEAEQMAKKADAWNEYGKAAIVDMMLQKLPEIASEIAAPITRVNKITMVADANGEVGAARMTDEVLSIMTKIPEVINNMTGVNIKSTMTNSNV